MIIITWCKAQIVCMLILAYISVLYFYEGHNLKKIAKKSYCNKHFDVALVMGQIAVLLDGITACTVNYQDIVPGWLNIILHYGMFASYEVFVTVLSVYWTSVTVGISKHKMKRVLIIVPCIVSLILTAIGMPFVQYIKGDFTNYSMGWSVYVCFGTILLYCIYTVLLIIVQHRQIQFEKRKTIDACLVFILFILIVQIIFPETLLSCIAATMTILGIYLNMENPAIHSLEHYHNEMVMGFATMVENKDDNTGGHIRRSSEYATLIARNLRKKEKYKNIITRDYLRNLKQSAPMHDIGKIGIPDSILQKPGKLDDNEFAIMKKHPVIGSKIIKETFGHLFNGEYENMAYQVALYHHEKWNGKGYPKGISGENIPLCARIMAVADVFDAVSAKRCYRDAMPLPTCYEIIINGRGVDFDPDVVDAFLENKEEVEMIYNNMFFGKNE